MEFDILPVRPLLIPRPTIYTNGKAIRSGLTPCETNPATGQLSYCREPFHARATVTVGSSKGTLRHVCMECANRYHKDQVVRHGIKWD